MHSAVTATLRVAPASGYWCSRTIAAPGCTVNDAGSAAARR